MNITKTWTEIESSLPAGTVRATLQLFAPIIAAVGMPLDPSIINKLASFAENKTPFEISFKAVGLEYTLKVRG